MSHSTQLPLSLGDPPVVITFAAVDITAVRFDAGAPTVVIYAIIAGVAAALFFGLFKSVIRSRKADPLSPRTIASFPTEVAAEALVDQLAAHDIEARAVGSYTSGFRAEAPGEVQVVVKQQDELRAREVVAKLERVTPDADQSNAVNGIS